MGSLTVNCVNYLIDGLNALENKGKPIANHLTNTFYFNENDIFEKALKYSLSQPERVMFHAYLRYLIMHKNDTTNLQQWMRVVHNLVENTRVDALAEFIGAIKSIDHLLEHSSDILHYLLEPKNKVEFFSTWQVEEERLKAHLSTSSVWLDVIMKCEEQNFHRGQIAYLFEFSGILEYFNEHKNIKWSVEVNQNFLTAFRYYMERSDALFSILDTKANDHYLLERAILSKGDYLIPATNNRFNFCSSKSVSNYLRDYSWKRLLRVTTDDDSGVYKTKRNFVMQVLTDKRFNTKNVGDSLMKLCEDLPADWRSNFVKNPGLIDYCEQGFICMTNDGEVELLGQSQLNHYHINMFIYNIYLTNIDRIDQFKPFKEMLPVQVKNNEDSTLVTFTDWKFKNKNYCIDITKHVNGFFIEFVKEKGKTKRVDYDINLEKVLLNNNMQWDETVESFTMIKRTEKSTIDFIKTLCKDLQILNP